MDKGSGQEQGKAEPSQDIAEEGTKPDPEHESTDTGGQLRKPESSGVSVRCGPAHDGCDHDLHA
jgi:hypothetical protein